MRLSKEQEMKIVSMCSEENIPGASSIIISELKASASENVDLYHVSMKALEKIETYSSCLDMRDKVEFVKKVIVLLEKFLDENIRSGIKSKEERIDEYKQSTLRELSEYQKNLLHDLCLSFGLVGLENSIRQELEGLPQKLVDGVIDGFSVDDFVVSILANYSKSTGIRLREKEVNLAATKIRTLFATLMVMIGDKIKRDLSNLEHSSRMMEREMDDTLTKIAEQSPQSQKEKIVEDFEKNDNVIPFKKLQ